MLVAIYVCTIGVVNPLRERISLLDQKIEVKKKKIRKNKRIIQKAKRINAQYQDMLNQFKQPSSNEEGD